MRGAEGTDRRRLVSGTRVQRILPLESCILRHASFLKFSPVKYPLLKERIIDTVDSFLFEEKPFASEPFQGAENCA
jgi:hypothetical protein